MATVDPRTLDGERLDLFLRMLEEEGIDGAPAAAPIPRRETADPAPASFAQRRLWFVDRLEPGSPAYNVPMFWRLRGALDAAALARALSAVAARHDALRTTFAERGGEPVQVVAPPAPVPLPVDDLSTLDDRLAEAERRAAAEAAAPFDLAAGPLLRARLLRLAADDHVFLLTLHHTVCDAWSLEVIFGELAALYRAERGGAPADLPPLPLQYGDYAAWQRGESQAAALHEAMGYWRRTLAGAPPLQLAADRPRPAALSDRGARASLDLPAETAEAVRALARHEGATPFAVLLSAFAVLAGRWAREDDVVVGMATAGRARRELEPLAGNFVNLLALRLDLGGDPTARELVGRASAVVAEALDRQEVPFERLVEVVAPERALGRTPLAQVTFGHQDASARALRLDGVEAEPFRAETGTTHFDLTLNVIEQGGRLRADCLFSTDLFDRETIDRFLAQYAVVLRALAARPESPISTLPLMDADERARVIAAGAAVAPVQAVATLHERFAAQAARTPDAVAVSFEGASLGYGELEARANRLARHLQSLGVGAETRVGMCVERSAEMVTAILGILKAGGAYVPLDPAYPADRLAYVLEDAGIGVVVTRSPLLDTLPSTDARTVCIDRDWPAMAALPADAPASKATPANTAYVIYTSGSTGRPKGCAVTHANATRLFSSTEDWFGFGPDDVWTLFHSVAFDFSVWEIWGALLYGGRLVVVPWLTSRTPADFLALLEAERVTVLSQTPSAFRQLAAADEERGQGTGGRGQPADLALRWVVFGGEALEPATLRGWVARRGDDSPRLVNMYGITETTVHVTYRPVTRREIEGGAPSVIGVPIPDLSLHLLDARGEPVPVGVPGEIHVGGAGVSRGYPGRPSLTAQRFVPDAFSGVPGARLYRSGDLARWTEESASVRECVSASRSRDGGSVARSQGSGIGADAADAREGERTDALTHSRTSVPAHSRTHALSLEYLGRIDQQVKVRGFRIEPAEIEAALAAHPAVRESVVLVAGEGDEKQLVAFVAAGGAAPSWDELRAFLKSRLPEQLIPAACVVLGALPLTPNGKTDRRALLAMERGGTGAAEFVAPRNPTEEALAAVWREVLGVERIGVRESFFAAGGDSIRAIRVVSAARERGLALTLAQLFTHQTIAELAAELGGAGGDPVPFRRTEPFSFVPDDVRRLLPAGVEDAYPLARMQAGMLYHAALHPDQPVYHNVDSFHLETGWDEACFRRAVDAVVARHPILRTGFALEEYGEPLQLVHAHATMEVGVGDLRGMTEEEQEREIDAHRDRELARPFDLARPPLLRFHVHRLTDDAFQFTLTECHAILDGWSLTSTLAEVWEAYAALLAGRPLPDEPPPQVHYRDFVDMERRALESPDCRAFWQHRLAGATPRRLPRVARAGGDGPRVEKEEIRFSDEVLDGLRAVEREEGVPLKTLLLAAHLKVLSLLHGEREVISGVAMNGRPEVAGGDRVRGLFLNTLPFRFSVEPGSWLALARRVLEAEREILPWRRYPVSALHEGRRMAPLFETTFNFVHFHRLGDFLKSGAMRAGRQLRERADASFTLAASFGIGMVYGGLRLFLACDRAELSDGQVETAAALYRAAVAAIAADPHARHDLAVLVPAVVPVAHAPEHAPPAEAPAEMVHARIEAQARRTPNALAVAAGDERITYAELNARANRLAWRLRGLGVAEETRVAICLPRGVEMVAAILGVLKAGAAYVPLDPAYPPERLAYMLADSGAAVLIAGETGDLPVPAGVRVLAAGAAETAGERDDDPRAEVPGGCLAYLIYTSGSTGRPKGVMVTRAGLAASTAARDRFYPEPVGAYLLLSSFSFDSSVAGLFWTLCGGGTLVVPAADQAGDPARVWSLVRRHAVTHLLAVPSLYAELLEIARAEGSLATVIVAGEACTPELVRRHQARLPGVALVNEYGPTESTVWSSAHRCGGEAPGAAVPIGVPVGQTRSYVLDAALRPVPRGVPGELCIGGVQVARGYASRPALTAERFVPDPFSPLPGARMYRTGDRARWSEPEVRVSGETSGAIGGDGALGELSGPAIVHDRFEAQARRTPDAPAVVFADETLTYAELDARANRLAHHLRGLGVEGDVRVAMCLPRGVDVVVAILGILKAGGAYVPLDPHHPTERLLGVLEDAEARVVITQGDADRFAAFRGAVVRLDADAARIAALPDQAPAVRIAPGNLAYVIYTSGSTGRPKGVMVEHRSAVNLFAALQAALYARRATDAPPRVSVNGPVTFDTSVKQLVQLLGGATLCIIPDEARHDAAAMAAYLREQAVEVLDCTPAQLRHLLAEGLLEKAGPALTDLLVAGEAIDDALWRTLASLEGCRAWNLYGPTETTVDAALCQVAGEHPVLGQPVPTARAYVVGADGAPAPAGIPGELCIGGAQVARGYAGRPALTAARFVPDPFAGEPGERMYRTGDRARWTEIESASVRECVSASASRENERTHALTHSRTSVSRPSRTSVLEYLGRADEQVKVRGFRVEPGEIEAVLRRHPAVGDCAVVTREHAPGDVRLVAYVTGGADGDALRAHLRRHLPEYMVPSHLVPLDALPLTPNGKLDRAALPAPAAPRGGGLRPQTGLEARIAAVWQELLGVGEVGVEDNLFDLGAHSLLLARMSARLGRELGRPVPLVELLRWPTVRSLARWVQGDGAPAAASAEQGDERGSVRQAALGRLAARRGR
jgi:amino acid adenylation domain-containing protein